MFKKKKKANKPGYIDIPDDVGGWNDDPEQKFWVDVWEEALEQKKEIKFDTSNIGPAHITWHAEIVDNRINITKQVNEEIADLVVSALEPDSDTLQIKQTLKDALNKFLRDRNHSFSMTIAGKGPIPIMDFVADTMEYHADNAKITINLEEELCAVGYYAAMHLVCWTNYSKPAAQLPPINVISSKKFYVPDFLNRPAIAYQETVKISDRIEYRHGMFGPYDDNLEWKFFTQDIEDSIKLLANRLNKERNYKTTNHPSIENNPVTDDDIDYRLWNSATDLPF